MTGKHQNRSDSGATSEIPGKTTLGSLLSKRMEGFSPELRTKQTSLEDSMNLYIPIKMFQVSPNQSEKPFHQ